MQIKAFDADPPPIEFDQIGLKCDISLRWGLHGGRQGLAQEVLDATFQTS
jgi:hypothetical protein